MTEHSTVSQPLRLDDPEIVSSYHWCKQVCRESGSSFYPAFALLDRRRRNAMYSLYAFARISDDLSDGPLAVNSPVNSPVKNTVDSIVEPAAVSSELRRRELLDHWRRLLHQNLQGTISSVMPELPQDSRLRRYDRLWIGLRASVQQFQIPAELLDELLDGVVMDLTHTPLANWQETENYCYHVASTVGLACTHIWKATDVVPREAAISCGLAFQLTNILRDVAEDARAGRIYIPATELQKFDIAASDWLAGTPGGNWTGLVDSVAERAYAAYQAGWEIRAYLTPRSQRMFSLMWNSYRSLLEEVVLNQSQLWRGKKTSLSALQKSRLLASELLPDRLRRRPRPVS